ncbi:hypothetical protein [Haloferula sp.]|uniref:hypothetical protein n=1 Tax=Haloferula sp. TaxID=2497595 RepID=UPI003C71ED7F
MTKLLSSTSIAGLISSAFFLCMGISSAVESYRTETIRLPEGIPPEIGGIQFDSEGTLYVVLRRNDILTAKPTTDPTKFPWKHFASGFHNGCGIEVKAPGHIVISQMPELTEVKDSDRDGVADSYRTLTDAWGVSGNYHETNEICPDGQGGYYIAVGTASYNGPTFHHVRGEYSKIGRRGRNYSSVQWKGWVMHYSKDGEVSPFAKGFRMHNGIMRDSRGNIWATDNQGDWRATTPLYHVQKDHFYGHPSSLVWDPKWPKGKDPLKMPLKEINEMRTRPAVLIPYQQMNRSASEPIEIPDGFGPFTGQILIPDNNSPRITRIMLDEVNGKFQGSCTHFINGKGLLSGGNRATFTADGKTLYTGHTIRGWGKLGEGLQRTTWQGITPFDVKAITLQKDGFDLRFTLPPANVNQAKYELSSFRYESTWQYGGPMLDKRKEKVSAEKIDENSIFLKAESLQPLRVYQITIKGLKSANGKPLANRDFYYTLNSLKN